MERDHTGDPPPRTVAEPEPTPIAAGPPPAVSERALALVTAFAVAQRNVSQAMRAGLDEHFRVAKAEHVRAYHELMEYIGELEGRRRRAE
ncbi:MAG: hypothetical protein ACJ79S_21490 [Gemmatimonadaceae bacterium]